MFEGLAAEIAGLAAVRPVGRVTRATGGALTVSGLGAARLGDLVRIGPGLGGEIVGLGQGATVLPEGTAEGVALGDPVTLLGPATLAPHDGWVGRVVDAWGQPLDGRPLFRGHHPRPLTAAPPPPATRRGLGDRLRTGLAVFDTVLPVVRGQRVGLFAGSGVGKSTLLADLARGLAADVVVVGLVGERGRELGDFVRHALGAEGLARAVVIAATSDRPALERHRAALAAVTAAEHFRDRGAHVLLLLDSVTRFAEAHRDIAFASGEPAAPSGWPPSLAHRIMGLAERAGPGGGTQGDITAVFSVLVAGSDMEEPVADILRGVLDGHVVLDRAIAERGRFPAVDLLRSVSRSLPGAATPDENALIARARKLLGAWERSETMVRAGLHSPGADPLLDEAVRLWPALDGFLADRAEDVAASFARLAQVLEPKSATARYAP
jgi:flagellum-specific ATP synthase